MNEVQTKMLERIEAELHYGIILADLDIRQFKMESINPALDQKMLKEFDAIIKQKETEKAHLEKRLSLLDYYRPINIDK